MDLYGLASRMLEATQSVEFKKLLGLKMFGGVRMGRGGTHCGFECIIYPCADSRVHGSDLQ